MPIIAAGLLAALLILSPVFASAQTTYTITVGTNNTIYGGTQVGLVTGTISPGPGTGTAASLQITNPSGTLVFEDAVVVSATGSFNDSFTMGANSNWVAGTYTLTASWSPSISVTPITATAQFTYTPSSTSSTATTTATPATVTQTITTTATLPVTTTTTSTATQTVISTTTQTSSSVPSWAYAAMVVLLIAGLAVGYMIKRPSVSKS